MPPKLLDPPDVEMEVRPDGCECHKTRGLVDLPCLTCWMHGLDSNAGWGL